MKVEIHKLFDYLLETTAQSPEAVIGFSLSRSPKLGDFIGDLDPTLSLDWNNTSFRGLPPLSEHVLRQAGLDQALQIDDVLITAGAAEANYLAIMQLVQPGDEIITETPGWPQVQVLGRAINAPMHILARREEEGWRFPMEDLAGAINNHTRLIFLSNPNNPTGKLLPRAELEEIADLADKVGAHVLVDEVYAGLEWESDRVPSIAGLYEKGITTGSVSKALGLQGLRTGWLISRDQELVTDAIILRENSSEIMNIMGEAIAEIALRPNRYQTALKTARSEGLANLLLLDRFILGQPLLSWHRPDAGLIGLAKLADGIDSDDLARQLLGPPWRTFVLPGSAYDEPHHIRVGVGGGPEVKLSEGLKRRGRPIDEQLLGRAMHLVWAIFTCRWLLQTRSES